MFGLNSLKVNLQSSGLAYAVRRALFNNNEQGLWYDLNDDSTIFQDSAGTTLATWGDPVGLVLDKHEGLALGAELVTNGTFTTDTNWTKAAGVTISGGVANFAAVNAADALFQNCGITVGRTYLIECDITGVGTVSANFGGNAASGATRGAGRASWRLTATSGANGNFIFYAQSFTGTIDNVTVKSIAGNHAIQSTSGSRPIRGRMPKRGRVNLLVSTATLATQNVTTTNVQQTLSFTGTGTVTLSGTSTAGPLVGTGVSNRVSLTFTPSAGTLTLTVTGSVTLAQLQLGAAFDNYQAVNDALGFNVTESGQPSCGYLSYNGSNQSMQTAAAVNFSATDEMSVFAGVRKVSDAADAIVIELSTNYTTNTGSFFLAAPATLAAVLRSYNFAARGAAASSTTLQAVPAGNSIPAPAFTVLTAISDISADSNTLRANGSQIGIATGDQGAGNYGNYVTYFGSRAGTAVFFNGLMFSTIIRGALTSGTLLTRTEQYVADRTPTVYAFPTATVAPVISGVPTEGQTLTSTTGTWLGMGTLTYVYQWKRGTENVGTNANTYVLTSADIGFNITCVVTANTVFGSSAATSNALGPVAAIVYEYLAYAAGDGASNANGDNSTSNNTTFALIGTSPKNDWVSIAARQFGGHGIDDANTLYAWGSSAASGDSTANTVPTQIGTAGEWSYIYSGLIIALGIKTNGTLWGWGSGLGAGTGASANATPTQVGSATNWVSAVNGEQHSGGIRADGTLWMWGLNTNYQLGDNTTTQRNTPVQIGVATTWAQLSCGNDVHTAAVRTDGTLWGWGSTANGRLGVPAGADQQVPTQIGSDTNWSKVQCGNSSTVALKTNGTIWAIGGLNASGELGQGNTTALSTPTQIGVATNWVDIILTNATTYAINSLGELWVCGDNGYYFFGDGTTTDSSTLVEITSLPGAHKVATSSRNTFVITETEV